MKTLVVQDFVTLRGASASTLTQSGHTWLDLPDVANAVAWLNVKSLTSSGGTISMSYQTSPIPDDSMFVPLTGPTTTVPFVPAVGVTVTPLLKDLLGNTNGLGLPTGAPLSRWFRWQVSASGSFSSRWDITFRLFLAIHCPALGRGDQAQLPLR